MNRSQIAFSFALTAAVAGCGNESDQGGAANQPSESTTENETKLWVTGDRLDRRTCPANSCGVVGQLFLREAVTPHEFKDGWVRVTKSYDAACEDGKSRYVKSGRGDCQSSNGIVDGNLAEWVLTSGLSGQRPADPAKTATPDETIVAQSNDFQKYRKQFARLAAKLIDEGRCTKADFEEIGGWLKSVTEHRNEPVYFAYCGGMTAANKIYVNAQSEKVLR